MRVYGLLLSSFLCFSLSAQTPVSSVLFPGDTTTLQVMISDTDAIQSPPLKVRGRAVTLDSFAELLGFVSYIDGDSICFVIREDTFCLDNAVGEGIDQDTGIVIRDDYDELAAYTGGANYVYVRDSLWGGYFELKASGTADTALIVAGPDRLWHRIVRDNRFWLTWFNEKFPTDTTWERRMQYAVDTISARHGSYGTGTLYVPYVDTPLVSDTYIYWLDTLGTDPYDTMDLKDVKYCVELKSNLCIVMDEFASFKLIDTLIKENADSTDRVNIFIADSIQNFAWTGGIIDGNAGNQFHELPGYYGSKWYGNLFQIYDTAQVYGNEYLSFRNIRLQNHSGQGIYFVDTSATKVTAENIYQLGLVDSALVYHIQEIRLHRADTVITECAGISYQDSTGVINNMINADATWTYLKVKTLEQDQGNVPWIESISSTLFAGHPRRTQSHYQGFNLGPNGTRLDNNNTAMGWVFENFYVNDDVGTPALDIYDELQLRHFDSTGVEFRLLDYRVNRGSDSSALADFHGSALVSQWQFKDPYNLQRYATLKRVGTTQAQIQLMSSESNGAEGIELNVFPNGGYAQLVPFGMGATPEFYLNAFYQTYLSRAIIQTLPAGDANVILGRAVGTNYVVGVGLGTGFTLDGGGNIQFTEVDGSISNELQTLANTSDATSHTVTLSNSGGSIQLVEGDFINMATSGTGLNGIATLSVDTTGFGAAYAEDSGNLAGNLDTLFHTSSSGIIDTVIVMASGTSDHDFYEVGGTSPPNNIADNIFKTPGTVHIGGSALAAQTLQVTGTLRVTASDGTSNSIMGRDADGDVSSISDGVGLTLSANVLNFDGVLISGDAGSVTWTSTGGILGGSAISTSGSGTNMTVNLNINELTEDAASEGDEFLAYYDVGGGTHEKIDVNNLPYIATEVDGSTTNEAWTIDAEDDANTEVIDNDQVTFGGTGGLVVTYNTTTNLLNYDATGVTGTGDGNGIYDGDGTAPADVDVTITDNINFDGVVFMDQTNLEVGINTSGPSHYLHVAQTADTKDGVFIESTTTADELATLNLRGRQDGTDGNSSRLVFSNFDDDVGAADATATLGWIEMDRSQDDDHGGIMTLSTNKINATETEHIVLDAVTETTKVNGLKVPQTTTATNITIGNDGGMYYQNGGAEAVTVTFPNADNVLGMVVYFYAPQVTTLTLAISGGSSDTITDLITNDQKVVTCYAIAANLWVCQN